MVRVLVDWFGLEWLIVGLQEIATVLSEYGYEITIKEVRK